MATKKQAWRKTLLATADKIEELGWCQGRLENDRTGAVCAVGGLSKVVNISSQEAHEVMVKFGKYLVSKNLVKPRGSPMVMFNDAKGRKKEQVLAAMRDCACNFECPDAEKMG